MNIERMFLLPPKSASSRINLCLKMGSGASTHWTSMWFLNIFLGRMEEVRKLVTAQRQINLLLNVQTADKDHSMRRNNKSGRVHKNVLLWSRRWLWAKVSTLRMIMIAGNWECAAGVFWDFHRDPGLDFWSFGSDEKQEGREGGRERLCSCGRKDAFLSLINRPQDQFHRDLTTLHKSCPKW